MAAAYSLDSYGRMLSDEPRMTAYAEAIRTAVKPGSIVLELGTGTGIMALMACQAGARRVYALEPADSILVARQTASRNGFADRIVFIQSLSNRIDLPKKCDVSISDMRGIQPMASSHLVDLMDARERLLTPGAIWICQKDRLRVAAACVTNKRDQVWSRGDGSR